MEKERKITAPDGATEAVIEKHTSERVMVLTRKEAPQ